jgi:hypothetical protein
MLSIMERSCAEAKEAGLVFCPGGAGVGLTSGDEIRWRDELGDDFCGRAISAICPTRWRPVARAPGALR